MKSNPFPMIKHALVAGLLLGSVFVASADPVVFNINLSIQTALGKFKVGNGDTVMLSGTFNNWATTNVMTVTANPDVYSITQNLSAGLYPRWKFIINPNGNSTGTALVWETSADRFFNNPGVPAGGTNLPVVYFSNSTNPPGLFHITFQVNMGVPITQGLFVPNSSLAYAFGSWSNWGSGYGLQLTNVPGTSNYMQTLDISNTLNSVISYKFNINGNGGTWEGAVGPNNTADRICTLTNLNVVQPLEYWNNITNAYTNYVTFQVDTLVEYALGVFDPYADYLYVNGDWDWSGTAMRLYQTADPYVFTNTVALHFAPGSLVDYKYTINGTIIWENDGVGPGGAKNHQFELLTTNLPLDHFNNYTDLGPVDISLSGNQAALSWASGSNANNHIRLQNSTNLSSGWTDVPNTQGTSAVTNNFGGGSQFFRLIGP
jgi:hypothetical protein